MDYSSYSYYSFCIFISSIMSFISVLQFSLISLKCFSFNLFNCSSLKSFYEVSKILFISILNYVIIESSIFLIVRLIYGVFLQTLSDSITSFGGLFEKWIIFISFYYVSNSSNFNFHDVSNFALKLLISSSFNNNLSFGSFKIVNMFS